MRRCGRSGRRRRSASARRKSRSGTPWSCRSSTGGARGRPTLLPLPQLRPPPTAQGACWRPSPTAWCSQGGPARTLPARPMPSMTSAARASPLPAPAAATGCWAPGPRLLSPKPSLPTRPTPTFRQALGPPVHQTRARRSTSGGSARLLRPRRPLRSPSPRPLRGTPRVHPAAATGARTGAGHGRKAIPGPRQRPWTQPLLPGARGSWRCASGVPLTVPCPPRRGQYPQWTTSVVPPHPGSPCPPGRPWDGAWGAWPERAEVPHPLWGVPTAGWWRAPPMPQGAYPGELVSYYSTVRLFHLWIARGTLYKCMVSACT